MMHWLARIVLAPIGGGCAVALLWLLVNSSTRSDDLGLLERQGWPLRSLYVCAALGAGVSLWQALISARRAHRRQQDLSGVAEALGMHYRPQASSEPPAGTAGLCVFSQCPENWNRLYGQWEGCDIQMVDISSGSSASGRRTTGSACRDQTVVVIRVRDANWPVFQVQPRGLATWFWVLLGWPGVRFRFRDPHAASGWQHQILRRFNRRYYVFVGLARRIAELAGVDLGLPMGSVPLDEREIAERFSVKALEQFSASRGWSVECCGSHIAFWRAARIVPGRQRESFLRQAAALYRSMADSAMSGPRVEVIINELPDAQFHRRLAGLIAGSLVGIALALLAGFSLLRALPLEIARWAIFLWPLLAIAFIAAGAWLGARLSGGPSES